MAEGCTYEEYQLMHDIRVIDRHPAHWDPDDELQLVRDGDGVWGTTVETCEDDPSDGIDREMVNWYVDEFTARRGFDGKIESEVECETCFRYMECADPRFPAGDTRCVCFACRGGAS